MIKKFLTLLLASLFLCVSTPSVEAAKHKHSAKHQVVKKKSLAKAKKRTGKKRGKKRAAVKAAPAEEESFRPADRKSYESCTKQVYQNAGVALQTAEQSLKKKKDIGMRHCKALALFALSRYPEASAELEGLGKAIGKSQPDLWLSVMQQAATAREQAKDFAKARANVTEVVNFTQEREMERPLGDLLLDRARLSRALREPMAAIQDLDHALALSPTNYKALHARAQIFIDLGQKDLARKDLEVITRAQPENKGALEMLKGLGK